MASLERLMAQHRSSSEQLKEIEAAREKVLALADPDRRERMIRLMARLVGVGAETATTLVHAVFSRRFRDRRALAGLRRHDRHALRRRRLDARAGPLKKTAIRACAACSPN